MNSERLTEALAVVGQISPSSAATGALSTAAIDMSLFRRVVFIVQTGVLGASATLDFAVVGDVASGGSYATAITGKAITQIVKASGDNKLALVEVTADDVAAQGLRYIKGTGTVGTAASIYAVTALAGFTRYNPASESNLAAVVEIVG